jgi:chemotaxis protein methyltransferase CheR
LSGPLDRAALADVATALQRACGIVFSDVAARPLRAGFAIAKDALQVSADALLELIRAGDRAATQVLVESTVVGETYFGRHPEQLEALRRELRATPPERPLLIWSAGCATGEEAYTLAMLLEEEGRRDASVVATDVSEAALQVARRGRYGPWALRGLAALARDRWLRADGDQWVVGEALRRRVRFLRHNLLEESTPLRGFDMVLCRNVLIYFDPPTLAEVVRRLFDATRSGGLLVLAPAEVPFAGPAGHTLEEFAGGAFWRKSATPSAGRAPPRPVAPRAVLAAPAPEASAPWPPLKEGANLPDAPSPRPVDPLEVARRAASEGRWLDAERAASTEGERSLSPGPYLFAAAAAEARGDLAAAAHHLGRALFLAPDHVVARASLVPIFERLGRHGEAASARSAALRELASIPDDRLLPGVEPISAGALRSALSGAFADEESA